MAWFNKKEESEKVEAKDSKAVQKENKKSEKKNTGKPDFKVTIWEDVGYSVREVKTFYAGRFIDEDKTPFIFNEELNFMELYPQDMKDMVKLDEKEIDKKILETTNKLKEIRNKKIEDYTEEEPNTRDLEFNLMTMNAKKRGLKFSPSGSYVNFDITGQVCFNFLRKGNSFYPFKWDTDTTFIHTAAEPVVKKAGILLRNKESKYLPKKIIETSTLILLVICIIGVIANLVFAGWLWNKYDKSNLAAEELKGQSIQNLCSEMLLRDAEAIKDIQKQIKMELNGSTELKIQGIVPK